MNSTREIRLYPNRRLYDPAVADYIRYSDVLALIRGGVDVTIRDSVHGTDRTAKVLIDLAVLDEQSEAKSGAPAFTEEFLRELIRLSVTQQAPLVAAFLDHSMNTLVHRQGAEVSVERG